MAEQQFTLLPASSSDLPSLVEVFAEAFAADPNFSAFYPSTPKDVVAAKDLEHFRAEYDKPGRRYFKLVDEQTGCIAAFSAWHFPHEPEGNDGQEVVEDAWPEGANIPLLKEFWTKLFAGRHKYLRAKDMYLMSLLAVRPEYQRKGLGSKLLEPVLEQVDKEQKSTYIEASKKGLGLYLKHGWKEIDELLVDQRPYGGTTVERTAMMMREPQPVIQK